MNTYKLLLIPLIEPLIDLPPAALHEFADTLDDQDPTAQAVATALRRIAALLELDTAHAHNQLHDDAQRARELNLLLEHDSTDISLW